MISTVNIQCNSKSGTQNSGIYYCFSIFHQLKQQDPIYCVNLREFTLQQLNECRQKHGEQEFARLMELVDCEIISQLNDFINQSSNRAEGNPIASLLHNNNVANGEGEGDNQQQTTQS